MDKGYPEFGYWLEALLVQGTQGRSDSSATDNMASNMASFNVEKDAEDPEEVRARMAKPFLTRLRDGIDELHAEGKVSVSGASFMVHLTSMYWGCRGYPESASDIALLPLQQALRIPSEVGTVLTSLLVVPWAMKPFFAILSDLITFAHYKKRWYMCIVAALGALGAIMVYLTDNNTLAGPTKQGTVLLLYFLLINMAIAMCDSLSQGKYTEICKWKGSTVVSYVSSSKIAAGLIASLVTPQITDNFDPKLNMLIIAPVLLQACVVFGSNFMGDPKQEKCCDFAKDIWQKDFKIIVTGLLLGFCAGLLVVFRLADLPLGFLSAGMTTASSGFLLAYSFASVCLILGMTFWCLPQTVCLIFVYIMFCRIATLDVRYVLQQWYTTQDCDDLPHFPNTVYQMIGLVMGNFFTLVGIWLFENYVYYWNARASFWVTPLFTVVAAGFDLMMLTRFNQTLWSWWPVMSEKVTWFCTEESCARGGYRLDDMFGFLVGMQALKPIATTLDDMPSTVLLSKLCPAGVETTVFAMLAAIMNLGMTVSGLLAGYFFQIFEVDVDQCEYGWSPLGPDVNGLQWALICGGVILPLTTIPAPFFLIPNKPLNSKFVEDAPVQEEELVNEDAHPAAQYGKVTPSYAALNNSTASKAELELGSLMIFNTRSGSNILAGSRAM